MLVTGAAEVPHAEPLGVQGEHPTFGLIDTTNLYVGRGLARFALMPTEVHDYGDPAGKPFRLVQQGRDEQARQGLVAELLMR